MKGITCVALVAMGLLPLAGCSGDGMAEVTGQVTLDGQGLSMGTISFFPADGKGPSAAAILKDGRYQARVTPGRKRVEILGYRKLGQKRQNEEDPSSPMIDVTEQIVPERYNARSELTCDVGPRGGEFNFELKK